MKHEKGADKARLTPFWRKVTQEAQSILAKEIKALSQKTVAPEFCLAARDKRRMESQQSAIKGAKAVLETVKKGGFWGKAWALDTVLRHKPSLLLR